MGFFKKLKFHTPSFHLHGKKYKVGYYGRFSVGVSKSGKLRGHWRSGWREHGRDDSSGVADDYRSSDVPGLLRPNNSARQVLSNQARFEYG